VAHTNFGHEMISSTAKLRKTTERGEASVCASSRLFFCPMMSRNFIVEDLELSYGQLDWSEYSNTDLRQLAFRVRNGSALTNGSEVPARYRKWNWTPTKKARANWTSRRSRVNNKPSWH
jgi:hypothetical protein